MGIYNKSTYVDRVVEFPNRYMETVNIDGTVTKTPNEGAVTTEGTPLSVDKFNNLENGILSAHNQIDGNADTQNPDSIQKQVNALSTKTQLMRADVQPGNTMFLITFTNKLMPGQSIRFVAKGESFHLSHVNQVRNNWTGSQLRANPGNTKFHTYDWETKNYATLITSSASGQYNQGAHGEIRLALDGTLLVTTLQTIDSNITSGWDNYMTKGSFKSSTLHPNGLDSLTMVNDSENYYAVSWWFTDSDGEIIGDLIPVAQQETENGGDF